jgi:hypothetical protein
MVGLALGLLTGPAWAGRSDEAKPALEGGSAPTVPAEARPWTLRADVAMLNTRDGAFVARGEGGLTIGRFVTSRLSLEGTAALASPGYPGTAWSAMANARWDLLRTASGHDALTLASGPLLVMNNGVHGTTPLAHGEVAYVHRASFGLTVLVAVGENMALTNSDYVAPPTCWLSCAQEIHRGDLMSEVRLGAGWTF